jgi:addiction module HigA family antidote
MKSKHLKPVTPGEILKYEFMQPLGLSAYRVAKDIGVQPIRITSIIKGFRSITPDTDLRLCRYFGLSKGYWLRSQMEHDLQVAEKRLFPVLKNISPIAQPAS